MRYSIPVYEIYSNQKLTLTLIIVVILVIINLIKLFCIHFWVSSYYSNIQPCSYYYHYYFNNHYCHSSNHWKHFTHYSPMNLCQITPPPATTYSPHVSDNQIYLNIESTSPCHLLSNFLSNNLSFLKSPTHSFRNYLHMPQIAFNMINWITYCLIIINTGRTPYPLFWFHHCLFTLFLFSKKCSLAFYSHSFLCIFL